MYTGLSGYGGILSLYIQYGHTQKVDSMSSVRDTSLTDTLPIHIRTYILTNIHTHVHMYIYIYKYVYMYACKHTNLKYVILKHNKINNLLKEWPV